MLSPSLGMLGLLLLALSASSRRITNNPSFGKRRLSDKNGDQDLIGKRATLFPPLSYSAGQISGGVAGNAAAQAQAVCTTPFAGVDLATVSQTDLDNLETFREAAQTAEDAEFVPQLAAATGTQAAALRVGLIKNKVLKLTCFQQVLQIKQAQGSDQTAALDDDTSKLATNVQLDIAAAGEASVAVA